jgi:hypothetical protein
VVVRPFFHAWERRIHAGSVRVVRPFDWGLDWLPRAGLPPLGAGNGAPADDRTIAAALVAAGQPTALSAEVVALTKGVVLAMSWSQLKSILGRHHVKDRKGF